MPDGPVDQLADRPLTVPHPDRLPFDHPMRDAILARHGRAMDSNEQGYLDPATGFFVMTARTLADRGSCCANGCRHCPYIA